MEVEVEVDSHRLSIPHIFFCGESSKRPMSFHTYRVKQRSNPHMMFWADAEVVVGGGWSGRYLSEEECSSVTNCL